METRIKRGLEIEMIKLPENETRNVNDSFYESERRRIDMLNREFFQDVIVVCEREEKRVIDYAGNNINKKCIVCY